MFRSQLTPDPLSYFQALIDIGGGMISLHDGLGVFVGNNVQGTPAGWLFVDIHDLTPEALKEQVDSVRAGRKTWPKS